MAVAQSTGGARAPKRVLVVLCEPPHAGARARERIDLVLMALAFELEVSVVFVGAGVLQLLRPDDRADSVHDHGAALGSLALYGIHGVYAEAEALRRYRLEPEALRIPVTVLDATELAALIHRQDRLL